MLPPWPVSRLSSNSGLCGPRQACCQRQARLTAFCPASSISPSLHPSISTSIWHLFHLSISYTDTQIFPELESRVRVCETYHFGFELVQLLVIDWSCLARWRFPKRQLPGTRELLSVWSEAGRGERSARSLSLLPSRHLYLSLNLSITSVWDCDLVIVQSSQNQSIILTIITIYFTLYYLYKVHE